jgi:hypothetical protein
MPHNAGRTLSGTVHADQQPAAATSSGGWIGLEAVPKTMLEAKSIFLIMHPANPAR